MYRLIGALLSIVFWVVIALVTKNNYLYIFAVVAVLAIAFLTPLPPLPPLNEFDENGEDKHDETNRPS